MRKILIILAIGIGLILLLGMNKSDSKLQGFESECKHGLYWQRVKNYEIIRASNLDKLQQNVKDKLNHGWCPMGEISYLDNNYCQVMVQ